MFTLYPQWSKNLFLEPIKFASTESYICIDGQQLNLLPLILGSTWLFSNKQEFASKEKGMCFHARKSLIQLKQKKLITV